MATLILTLSAWLLLLLPGQLQAADEKPSSVQDLRYGVALFHYFQKNHYDALSELMVAEQRGGIQGHGDTGRIMQGGLSLAMGMEQRAADIFNRILDQGQPQEVRDAAWFYLAKLRYRRADWDGAANSLAKISGKLNRPMRQERQALLANLAIRRQHLAQAEQALSDEAKLTPWLPYVYYNLGAAHIREDNHLAGVRYFDSLANLPLETEEHLTLRDKALTAAGYSLMQQGDYAAAIARFKQVRLRSPLIDQALLGYGWAASEIDDYSLALTPWQTLVQRSWVSPSVQEALLAIPYAYEKVGAVGQALSAFQEAELNYTEQLVAIDAISEQLQSGDLLTSLQADNVNPYLLRLTELLAQQRFQNQVSGLRDLLSVKDRLQHWQDKLVIYRHLLEQRELVREDRLTVIRERQFPSNLAQLEQQYQDMSNRLGIIEQQQDAMALADQTVVALWRRVESAERSLALLESKLESNGEATDSYREPLRRYRGMLLWQASEQFPANLWQAQKGLKQLQSVIDTARQQHQQMVSVIRDAPDIHPYQIRLTALAQRLAAQQLALNTVLNQSEQQLLALVREELQQQKGRLRYYQGHARLALARLYDTAREASLEHVQ